MSGHFLESYMYVVALLNPLVYFNQALKIFRKKTVKGVSLLSFLLALCTGSSWATYGWYLSDTVLIMSGALCALGSFLVVVGYCMYRRSI
jgi:uncharacterized protein with PQ loop repeat